MGEELARSEIDMILIQAGVFVWAGSVALTGFATMAVPVGWTLLLLLLSLTMAVWWVVAGGGLLRYGWAVAMAGLFLAFVAGPDLASTSVYGHNARYKHENGGMSALLAWCGAFAGFLVAWAIRMRVRAMKPCKMVKDTRWTYTALGLLAVGWLLYGMCFALKVFPGYSHFMGSYVPPRTMGEEFGDFPGGILVILLSLFFATSAFCVGFPRRARASVLGLILMGLSGVVLWIVPLWGVAIACAGAAVQANRLAGRVQLRQQIPAQPRGFEPVLARPFETPRVVPLPRPKLRQSRPDVRDD